jgi:hypothetical protein
VVAVRIGEGQTVADPFTQPNALALDTDDAGDLVLGLEPLAEEGVVDYLVDVVGLPELSRRQCLEVNVVAEQRLEGAGVLLRESVNEAFAQCHVHLNSLLGANGGDCSQQL